MTFSFLLFYAFSTSYVGNYLIKQLESQYEPLEIRHSDVEAIVVLTAGTQVLHFTDKTYKRPSDPTLLRLLEGIRQYKKLKKAIIISGGSGNPARTKLSEAPLVKNFLSDFGLPLTDIIIEGNSRNTLEEAQFTAKLMDKRSMKKKIILCTSAFHMKRSVKMFEDHGFTVYPAPCHYKSQKVELHINSFLPQANNIKLSSTAISELLIFYGYQFLHFFKLS